MNPKDAGFNPQLHKIADSDIFDKLYPEAEGILAYLVTYLPYLNELKETNVKQTEKLWHLHSESALAFYEVCKKSETSSDVNCTELYLIYKQWCKQKGVKTESQKRFGTFLKSKALTASGLMMGSLGNTFTREFLPLC